MKKANAHAHALLSWLPVCSLLASGCSGDSDEDPEAAQTAAAGTGGDADGPGAGADGANEGDEGGGDSPGGEFPNTEGATTAIYNEPWRPQIHYSPPFGWMNDPNGLVFAGGNWHLFYQNNPLGDGFGFISWGHAISGDLALWKPLGIAIPFAERTLIFSGGAVVDSSNTSGLCAPESGDDCVIAIYTANVESEGGVVQNQNLAFSSDGGRTFTVFEGNPVLDMGVADFRDPKVFWHEPSGRWIQVVALPLERRVAIYGSPNLIDWEFLSDFGPAGNVEGIWECPDLFELPVPGAPDETQWVMKVDHNPGHVSGGSGGQYFLGSFDGVRFEPSHSTEQPRWVDWGTDFYCATTWSNPPDGQAHWIGWMDNWQYASDIPTDPWKGQMTLPRRVELVSRGDELVLGQRLEAVEQLRGPATTGSGPAESLAATLDALRGMDAFELQLDIAAGATGATELSFTQEGNEPYGILRVREDAILEFERPDAGNAEVNETFPRRIEAPLPSLAEGVQVRVVADRNSIEVLAADGTVVITALVFPTGARTGVQLVAGPDTRFEVTVWPSSSIWR